MRLVPLFVLYVMLWYHRQDVAKAAGSSAGHSFHQQYLDYIPLPGSTPSPRCYESRSLPSTHPGSHQNTPRGERALFLPRPLVLSASLSSQIIHSRAKSQSLSASLSAPLYGSVSRPQHFLPSITLPFYHLPPLCLSETRKQFTKLVMFSWKRRERSVSRSSQSARRCA